MNPSSNNPTVHASIGLSVSKTARFAVLDATGVKTNNASLDEIDAVRVSSPPVGTRSTAGDAEQNIAHIEEERDGCELHVACRMGNMDRVQYLVEVVRRDINEVDAHNSTPLYCAALCGHRDVCKYLLDNGARCSEDAQDSARIYYAALNDDLRRMLRQYHLSRASAQPFFELLRKSFNDPEFADVEVEFPEGGESVFMHAAMIHIRCPCLAKLLLCERPPQAQKRKRVQLPAGFNETSSYAVLEYLYTGRFETQNECMERDVLSIARELRIGALEQELHEHVMAHDGEKRRIRVEHQAQLHSDMALLARAVAAKPRIESFPDSEARSVLTRKIALSTSDVTLRGATGEKFWAHRFILCSHSDYFRGALLGSFVEAQDNAIALSDVSPEAVAATCEWMYSDKWTEAPDAQLCVELLDVSSRLLLPRMAALVSTVLSPHVDDTNVFDLLKLSYLHRLQKLEDTCVRVLALRIEDIANSGEGRDAFLELIKEEVATTTQKGNINVTDAPLVADIRQILTDQYSYLSDDDEEEISFGTELITQDVVGIEATSNGRSLRQERRHKLLLLDTIVEEALSLD